MRKDMVGNKRLQDCKEVFALVSQPNIVRLGVTLATLTLSLHPFNWT